MRSLDLADELRDHHAAIQSFFYRDRFCETRERPRVSLRQRGGQSDWRDLTCYWRSPVLKNDVHGMVFRNSIIRFDLSVKLSNDVFVDCIFIFPPEQNPTGPLQQIGRTLLASNLENVTLNAS